MTRIPQSTPRPARRNAYTAVRTAAHASRHVYRSPRDSVRVATRNTAQSARVSAARESRRVYVYCSPHSNVVRMSTYQSKNYCFHGLFTSNFVDSLVIFQILQAFYLQWNKAIRGAACGDDTGRRPRDRTDSDLGPNAMVTTSGVKVRGTVLVGNPNAPSYAYGYM